MNAASLATLITAVGGLVLGTWATIRSGRSEKLKADSERMKGRLDETDTAFTVLTGTIDRMKAEIAELRLSHEGCQEQLRTVRHDLDDARDRVLAAERAAADALRRVSEP